METLLALKNKGLDVWKHDGFQKYFRNTGWMFLGRIFSLLVSFFVTIYVVRYLGPENYGRLSYSVGFVGLFSIFASLGIGNVVYRELVRNPEKEDVYLGTAFIIRLFAGIVTFILAVFISYLVNRDDNLVFILTIIISFSFIFQPLHILDKYFSSKMQSRFIAISSFSTVLILSSIKLIIVFLDKGVIYLSLVFLVEAILTGLFLSFFYLKGSKIKKWLFNKNIAVKLLLNSWPFIFVSTFSAIYARIDQVMLKNMLNITSVGIYDSAVRLTEIWYMVPNIIVMSIFPALIYSKKNPLEYRKRLRFAALFFTILSIIIVLVTLLFSNYIVNTLYGSEFSQASYILNIYILSIFGSFMSHLVNYYLLSENKQKISILTTLLTMVINVVLNLFLIPKYGVLGAAWSTVISYTLLPIIPFISAKVRRDFLGI